MAIEPEDETVNEAKNAAEIEEITAALSTGGVSLLLIAHDDGRVTLHTKYGPRITGEYLSQLAQTMTGDEWNEGADTPE